MGSTWTKPMLTEYTTNTGTKNNAVFAPGPSFYFGSVLHEPQAPLHARFKMVYWDVQVAKYMNVAYKMIQFVFKMMHFVCKMMIFALIQLGPGPLPTNPHTRVPGLYTALSADGLHWVQQQAWGVPKIVGGYGDPGPMSYQDQDPNHKPNAKGQWDTELSESDAMNLVWDPKMKEYKVYHKTWIDGVDGTSFWKRAVMVC